MCGVRIVVGHSSGHRSVVTVECSGCCGGRVTDVYESRVGISLVREHVGDLGRWCRGRLVRVIHSFGVIVFRGVGIIVTVTGDTERFGALGFRVRIFEKICELLLEIVNFFVHRFAGFDESFVGFY